MLAESERTDRKVFVVAKAELPGGTEWWARPPGVASDNEGLCKPIVKRFGRFGIGADFGDFSVALKPKTITVVDEDRFLSTMLARGEPVRGSSVTSYYASNREGIVRADWLELHSGVITGLSGTPGGTYQVTIDPDARWLNNKIGWPITEPDWGCDAEYVGRLAPICMGLWDASAGTIHGAVAPARISSTEWVFAGWNKSIDRVYVGVSGSWTLKVEGAGAAQYQVDHPVRGGKTYTRLTFGTAQAADAEVRCDVHGLESVGDGSGSMLVDPGEQTAFVLSNFGWAYPGPEWDDGSAAPINMTSIAALTTALSKAIDGAPVVGAQIYQGESMDDAPTGWQVLEQFAKTPGVGAHFDWGGLLAAPVEDLHASSYVTSPLLLPGDIEGLTTDPADVTPCQSVAVRYGRTDTGQTATHKVVDVTGEQSGEHEVQLALGPSCARGAILDPKLSYTASATKAWWHAFESFVRSERTANSVPLTSEGANFSRLERGRYAYPVMRANGHGATGPALNSMFTTHKTIYVAVCFHSITTDQATIHNNEAVWCRDGSTPYGLGLFARNVGGTGTDYRVYGAHRGTVGGWVATAGISVELDTWYVISINHNGVDLVLAVDDYVGNTVSVATDTTTGLAGNLVVGRNWKGTPDHADISLGEMIVRSNKDSNENGESVFAALRSRWGDRGNASGIAAWRASQEQYRRGHVPLAPEITTKRLDLLDLDIGDRIALQHPQYPHRDGADGAKETDQDRRAEIMVTGLALDVDDDDGPKLIVSGLDQRHRSAGCYLRFDPPDAASEWNDGSVIMLPPDAWFHDIPYLWASGYTVKRTLRRPGDGLYTTVYPGMWGLEPEGLALEWDHDQLFLNSAFVSGTTSWNPSSGGGGLTPSAETTVDVFWATSDVTTQNIVLTQDATPTNVKSISQAVTVAYTQVFSCWHRDDTGAVLKWSCQRASDNWWWNDATPGWQAGACTNAMTESGSGTIARAISKQITNAGSTTYTYTIQQDSGGTGSRVNRVYCALAEGGNGSPAYAATSPIITTTAIGHRPHRQAEISADSANPVIFRDRGTVLMAFRLLPGDIPGGVASLYDFWDVTTGGGDSLYMRYDSSTQSAYLSGGASLSVAWTDLADGDYHWIALRYSSASGDEDLAATMSSVIFDGTESADTAYAGFATVADQRVSLGGSSSGLQGHVRAFKPFPRVLSLEECIAWGRRHTQ
jgi:hypothetical protein